MKPIRIQRKRVKGWKMPENTVSVTRPGKWGNPFRAVLENNLWWVKDNEGNYWDAAYNQQESAVRRCIELYRAWIEGKIDETNLDIEQKPELDIRQLRGKNLACFCKVGDPCHADVLLEIANK